MFQIIGIIFVIVLILGLIAINPPLFGCLFFLIALIFLTIFLWRIGILPSLISTIVSFIRFLIGQILKIYFRFMSEDETDNAFELNYDLDFIL